jgi:hypothetical protein
MQHSRDSLREIESFGTFVMDDLGKLEVKSLKVLLVSDAGQSARTPPDIPPLSHHDQFVGLSNLSMRGATDVTGMDQWYRPLAQIRTFFG